ncbi:hypothetical protein FSP39_014095 [Pinctada imbricata]|uniref:Dendritic cell-specific transmembrane protein-like domain-containing protein n=1 Tax=Pinctada imbricata TaxID=66713 RepID=A0AA88YN22_PINIB|nr:hypothetical protein FSP39_014095 [Pinctada imbricata]
MDYDLDCSRKGGESVLPLRRREVGKYIFTTSKHLSMTEVSKLKKSGVTFLYHIIISTVIITFDHLIYYVLKLIQRYAAVALTVEGINTIDIEVEGTGFFTNMVRAMVTTININSTYSVDFNFTTCLPNPREPKVSSIPGIVILYALALCFLFMQAYGYRLRRKIASVFYPEQEACRISYLHAKILHERKTFAAFLKELVFRRQKEKELRNHITFRGLLSRKIPWLTNTCHWLLPDKRSCHGCDIRTRQGITFVKCQNAECNALFCKECFEIMKGRCFVCDKQNIR